MGETVSVHFKDDELREWVDRQWEDGHFASRSHVIAVACEELRQNKTDNILV